MDHNEYLKIRRRVAEALFVAGLNYRTDENVLRQADEAIRVAEMFATRLRLSEAKEMDLDGVYKDFDHLPAMLEEPPVDEEELLNYLNNIPQSDEGD